MERFSILQSVAKCSPGDQPLHAEELRLYICSVDWPNRPPEVTLSVDRDAILKLFESEPFDRKLASAIAARIDVSANVDEKPRPMFSIPKSVKLRKKMPFYVFEALESYLHTHVLGEVDFDDNTVDDLLLITADKVFHWKPN